MNILIMTSNFLSDFNQIWIALGKFINVKQVVGKTIKIII